MERPYIVCHMMTALDGKITGLFMNTEIANVIGEEYERINESYNSKGWLCGRVKTDVEKLEGDGVWLRYTIKK